MQICAVRLPIGARRSVVASSGCVCARADWRLLVCSLERIQELMLESRCREKPLSEAACSARPGEQPHARTAWRHQHMAERDGGSGGRSCSRAGAASCACCASPQPQPAPFVQLLWRARVSSLMRGDCSNSSGAGQAASASASSSSRVGHVAWACTLLRPLARRRGAADRLGWRDLEWQLCPGAAHGERGMPWAHLAVRTTLEDQHRGVMCGHLVHYALRWRAARPGPARPKASDGEAAPATSRAMRAGTPAATPDVQMGPPHARTGSRPSPGSPVRLCTTAS